MSKDHSGCVKQFHHFRRAWYGKNAKMPNGQVDEVMVGFYSPEGGTSGEFAVIWMQVCGEIVPCLEVFDDAWHALAQFKELIDKLAEHDDENITPEQFCALCRELGIEDATEEVQK